MLLTRLLILWLASLCLGAFGMAAPLKDGDRVVFCGDSITDMKLYTRLVMDYYALRYPGMHLVFYNVGISGSTAGGWKVDGIPNHVLPLKPTVVTICLGMNDGAYRAYDQKIADAYEANMTSLITQITAGGARVVLLTPGAVDDDTLPAKYGKGVYNETLNQLAQRVEAIAARERLPVYNIHTLMLDLQTRAKTENPAFAMSRDGVHPGEAGAAVMAYGLLKALDAVTPAASLTLDAAQKTVTPHLCTVTDLKVSDELVAFTRTDDALPTYLPPEALKAFGTDTTIFDELNAYRLTVTGLKAGAWTVQVESNRVGTFRAEALAQGVNLGNAPGPWQALAKKIDAQAAEASHTYDVVFHGLSARHFPHPAETDAAELRQAAAEIEAARLAFIQRILNTYEAHERARADIAAADRTWHWTLTWAP